MLMFLEHGACLQDCSSSSCTTELHWVAAQEFKLSCYNERNVTTWYIPILW